MPSTRLTSGRALQIPTLQELSRSDIKQEIAILRAKLHARSPSNHNSFRGIDSETKISHQEAEDISILSTEGMKIAQKKDKEDILEMGETSKIKYRAETGIEENKLAKLECFLHQRDAAAFSCLLYGMVSTLISPKRSSGCHCQLVIWRKSSCVFLHWLLGKGWTLIVNARHSTSSSDLLCVTGPILWPLWLILLVEILTWTDVAREYLFHMFVSLICGSIKNIFLR